MIKTGLENIINVQISDVTRHEGPGGHIGAVDKAVSDAQRLTYLSSGPVIHRLHTAPTWIVETGCLFHFCHIVVKWAGMLFKLYMFHPLPPTMTIILFVSFWYSGLTIWNTAGKQFSECASQPRRLWCMMSSVLGSSDARRNETSPSAQTLLEFFNEKVEAVRHATGGSPAESYLDQLAASFSAFEQCTPHAVEKFIQSAASKSCTLDPIRTTILKEFYRSYYRLSHECAMRHYRRIFCRYLRDMRHYRRVISHYLRDMRHYRRIFSTISETFDCYSRSKKTRMRCIGC